MSQLERDSSTDLHGSFTSEQDDSMPGQAIDPVLTGVRQDPLLWLQVASAIAVLVYVILLLVLSHTSFPESMRSSSHWPFLMDKPVGEDGYYMLTVAHNIATKGRILYNRGAVATGIQPLATFAFAGLDLLIHDRKVGSIGLIRATLLFGGILFIAFAAQMSSIARELSSSRYRTLAGALTFLMILFDFTLFRLFTYGLETGVYLICLAACFSSTIRISQAQNTTTREALWLGLVAGLAGEARIDFGVIFAIVLAGLLIMRWMSPLKVLITGAVAVVIVSPWFLFLHRVSGSWMPSSGPAESSPIVVANAVRRITTMYPAVVGHLMPWVYGVAGTTTTVAATLSIALLVAVTWRTRKEILLGLTDSSKELLLLWSASFAVLIVIYFVMFDSSHFYYRYAAPIVVVSVPLLAVALSQIVAVRRYSYVFATFLIISFVGWAIVSLHTGRIGNRQTVIAGYVLRNYPQTHVGAFQSGVVGYFNPNVENLDGKLNAAALKASKRHQLGEFVDAEHIDVIVDWPGVIYSALPQAYLHAEWQPCPVPIPVDEAECLVRRGSSALTSPGVTGGPLLTQR